MGFENPNWKFGASSRCRHQLQVVENAPKQNHLRFLHSFGVKNADFYTFWRFFRTLVAIPSGMQSILSAVSTLGQLGVNSAGIRASISVRLSPKFPLPPNLPSFFLFPPNFPQISVFPKIFITPKFHFPINSNPPPKV